MPRYVVPYTADSCSPTRAFPRRAVIYRPILPITLINGARTFKCYAVVDSGADDCLFPYSFGRRIGLKIRTGRKDRFIGVEGRGRYAWYFDIKFSVGSKAVVTCKARVGFTRSLEEHGCGLLGQTGFFDKFRIVFDYKKGIFQLENEPKTTAS